MSRLIAASVTLAIAVGAAEASARPQSVHHVPMRHGQPCQWHHGRPVLFRVKHAVNAARAVWAGTRSPTRHDWRVLLFIARCQHNPHASSFVHAVYRGFRMARDARAAQASITTRFDGWAIPARIVYCESGYANLPPNSADASGYYQMLGSTFQSWASAAGLSGMPSEAYEASRQDQGIAAAWGYDHSGSSPWSASQGCWG